MAFNAKNKDKITAVKGHDSSAVYTEQDQKKRLEAAAEAGRKARQAAVEKLKKQNRESREANDKARKQAVAQSNANRAKTASIEERVDQKRQITDAMTKTREWGAGKGDKWQSQGDFQTAYNAYENAVNWAEQAEAAGDAATAKYMREAASYLAKWGNAAGAELTKITNQYGSFDNAVDYRSGDKSGYREYLNKDKTWDEINRHITELKRTIDTTSDLKRRAEYMDELAWYEDYARNNYTEAAQGELEQLQRMQNTLQSALAQADINNSPLTGTPVGDRQRAETLRRFDEDIAAAKAGNMDAWYISALEKAREQFLADEAPVSYEQNWHDIDRYDELSGRVEGMNAQIADAEKTLKKAKDSEYERENRIKYAALEQEMNAADWYFDQYDYEDFKQLVAREKNSAATMGMPDIYTVDVRDQYTKDEASIYMYLREKGRAAEADAYANYMQSAAAARRNQQIGQRLAAEDIGIIGRTIGSVAANPGKIANTIDINLQKLSNALSDDYVPIDYETTANFGVASNVNRELATQELNALGTLNDLIGRNIPYIGSYTLGDLYGTGVDYLNSAMNAVLFGTSGAGAALGVEKFSDEYRAAKERGGSDNEAFNYAWGSSIAEGVGEQIVLDRYLGFLTKLGKRPGKAAAVIAGLFSMAEGGVQEVATTVMENAIDKWTMGDNSEYSRAVKRYEAMGYERGTAEQMAIDDMNREILKSGIMGVIGQGAPVAIGGAAYGISDAIEDAGATRALGKDIIGQGNAAGMAQLIGEVSGEQTNARTSAGAVGRQYTKFAQNVQKYVEAADESVRGVIKEKAERVMMAPVTALDGTSQATKEKASKRTAAMRKSDEGASVGGESVTVQGFVKTAGKSGDARLNIKKADGTLAEANMEDVTFDSKTAEVYSYAADMATPELANMFRMSIQPDQMAGIERVANGYSQAYDMAKAGFKEASVRASSLTDALTDEQVSAAYKLGADARSAGQMQAITAARQRAEANMGKAWKGGKATFDESVVVDALDDEQKNQIDMASAVTGAMGVNVVFFESKADETGRYTRENGSYNRKTNTIYIDVNAGRNYKGDSMTKTALLRTLSHEVTHAIQRNSPEIYAELRDTVTDILGDTKGTTIEDLIDRKLAQDGSLTTRDAAMDELVADACEKMLEDSDAAQRLAEAHPEAAKTFFRKVGELLTKLKEAIKAAFKGRQLSTEAQLVMKDVERYQKMVELWTKGVIQTAEVSGREYAETAALETENAAISEETTAEGKNIISGETVGPYDEPARPAEVHIDNRTWENVGDRSVKAFMNEYRGARSFMLPALQILRSDVLDSTRGERMMIRDEDGRIESVTGQHRQTTEQIAELKDRGYTWERLEEALTAMESELRANGEENALPDTAIVKRIELALDDMLTNGYDSLGGGMGVRYAPDAEYIWYKATLPGAAKYDAAEIQQAEGRQFVDDVQFQTRDTSSEASTIREQIKRYQEQLNGMLPVFDGRVEVPEQTDKTTRIKWVMSEIERYGYLVERDGFGSIVLDEKRVKRGLSYIKKEDTARLAAFAAVPAVLRDGIQIGEHYDHKDRRYPTVTFAAPVILNNKRGNLAVTVTKTSANNYRAHRILLPDGSAFIFEKENAGSGTSSRAGNNPRLNKSAGSASENIIPQSYSDYNPDIQKQARDQTDTPEFKRWFKGSQIVNEDGSPKLMYHGTPYGGFTVFKDWQYFTDNREYADVYHSPSASSIRGRYNDATNPMTYAVYLNVKKPFDTRDPKIRRIWQEEFYDNYSRTPLSDKGLPDWTDGIDLVEFIEDNEYDYDAIILDEGAVGGYGDDIQSRGISVVVRNSNQIKSATDNIGTFDPDDPDIQHQTREEAISTRFVLANMLEADAVNGEEVAWLRGYKNQFAKLEQLLGAIDQNKKIIRELMFKKGRTEAESIELQKARDRNKILQDKVASIDEGLLKLEKADVIRSLVAREEQKIRDKEAEKRREGIAKVRENQRNTAIRKNIQRRAKRLDRMLRQPSDKEHIPEGLRGAMLDMMEIFAGSEAAFGGAKADRERLYRAQREYEAMRGDEDNADLASRYDEDTADRLRQLADLMKNRKISDFNNAELTQLSMVIEHFEHLVRDQNDEFAQSRRKITEGYAEQIWQQTMTMKGRKENAITGSALVKALKHLGHANVIPPYFYKHLGGAMGKLGNDLLKAEGRYGVNMNKAAKRLDEIRRKYEHDKWVTKKGDILKLETEIGDTLELTREQALGIWASAKRERLNTVQRAAHLRDGGVILEKPARKLGRKGQEINVTPTKISQRDIQQIDKWLTDQQKAYADEMVGYISRDMAALGNETSMELAGYKKFGEGYYYPYKTSSDFRRTELGKVEDALIKNMGFTKSVVRNAKTPVVITDFSATVADHVNAMIMYNAFAVAQDQMMRVYDFKLDDSNSVKNLLRNAFGDEIPAYIEQHMRDLYGGVSPDRDAGLISWTIGAHKKQAVLGSASVVVQQPTALIRAMSQVNPKYFVGQRVEGGFDEAMDYAGTAVIKDIGGFDSGVGRGATDWLNGRPKDWQNHAIKSGLDTVSDWAGLGAEYADKLAWTAIWKAVKREQADKYKVDINSQELKEIAGERFDEVVRLTQVYDSVMTRSQLMRNKNLFWKMATSFMSEPTVTWNMMYDAGIEAFKNKKTGAAIGITASVLVSVILTNLAKAAVTAARDDDDEEATYLERYVKNAAEGLINDAVPFNYMPIVRDIYSKLQGYEVERADMGIINDMLAAGEVMLDEEKAPIAKVKSLVTLVSIMTGVPAKNIWRDVEAAFNTAGATPQSEARPGWLENALRTGAIDATPIGKWFDLTDSKANNADRLYEAILDGDMARAEELREHLITFNGVADDDAVDSLMRNRIKEGFIAGEIDEDEALEMLTEHGGKRRNEAEDLISEWSYTRDNDGRKYDDMKDAFLAGEISAEEAIDARVKYGGAEEENSERTVQTWQYQRDTGYVYDDMRDDVLDGEISAADAIAYRVKYGGVKQETAEATVGKWEYERKYGYAYEDLREEHAAGNITSSEAIRAMTEYGGKDEDDAYWEVAEWDYVNDGGEWDGKGTLLNDAFAGGNAAKVRSSMAQLLEHSDWKKPGNELASYVTNYYKPLFETATADRKRQLQPVILDYIQMAYEAAGEEYFGDDYTLRYRSWLKIK